VRFQPSAYSDVAATASPAGAAGVSPDMTSTAIQAGGQIVNLGLDAWQRSADSKAEKWRKVAAKKAKKAAAKKRAAAEAAAAAATSSVPVPLSPVPTTMSPWVKWGLIAGGVGIVGFALYMLTRKKDEPKPKHNPKRIHVKSPPKRRVANVRPAATELPSREEHAEEEDERLHNPDEDYGEGEDFAGEEE